MTDRERRRLRRSAALHGFAVVVFALLALSGAGAATQGAYALAVPFAVAGLAGAAGAAVIAVAVWRAQAAGGRRAQAASGAAAAPQRAVRLAMAAAAGVVVIAGTLLAPQGMDRGFVITVAALLAAALALFALLAGDRPRTGARSGP